MSAPPKRVPRYTSSPPSLPSARHRATPLPPPPPAPQREITFTLRGHPPSLGVPLSYLLSLDSASSLSLADTPELEGACDRVFSAGGDQGKILVHIACPVYTEIGDACDTCVLPLSLDPILHDPLSLTRHRTTRAALGKRLAEVYRTFLTETAHARFGEDVASRNHNHEYAGTGPFGERVEEFSLVRLRCLRDRIWAMEVVINRRV